MDRFVSHFENRLDAKGRVSIPATFRAVLSREGAERLFIHPCLDHPAYDAGGPTLIADIDRLLASFPAYSVERDEMALALLGTSDSLSIDGEGRIVLTESHKLAMGVRDSVLFVGLGHKFQIWEPERFRAHLAQARAKVRDVRRTLSGSTEGSAS